MAARTLDQIIAELTPTFNPQIEAIRKRQEMIPGQIASQEAGLTAQRKTAYDDILSGARSRGTGVAFGGIPLGEQARYSENYYMPALANLRTAGIQQAQSLEDAILGINERRDTMAQNIFQQDQTRAAQEAAEARQLAAQQSQAQNYLNMMRQQQVQPTTPTQEYTGPFKKGDAEVIRKGAGNYSFIDTVTKKPITAYQYALRTNQDVGDILYEMGADGDVTAQKIYNQLVDSPNRDITMKALGQLYPWLLGNTAPQPAKTSPTVAPKTTNNFSANLWNPGLSTPGRKF